MERRVVVFFFLLFLSVDPCLGSIAEPPAARPDLRAALKAQGLPDFITQQADSGAGGDIVQVVEHAQPEKQAPHELDQGLAGQLDTVLASLRTGQSAHDAQISQLSRAVSQIASFVATVHTAEARVNGEGETAEGGSSTTAKEEEDMQQGNPINNRLSNALGLQEETIVEAVYLALAITMCLVAVFGFVELFMDHKSGKDMAMGAVRNGVLGAIGGFMVTTPHSQVLGEGVFKRILIFVLLAIPLLVVVAIVAGPLLLLMFSVFAMIKSKNKGS